MGEDHSGEGERHQPRGSSGALCHGVGTYIPTYLSTYPHTYIHTYIPTYPQQGAVRCARPFPHSRRSRGRGRANLPAYPPTHIHTVAHSTLPTYPHTHLPTYSSSCESSHLTLPTYLPTYLQQGAVRRARPFPHSRRSRGRGRSG